MFDIFAWKKKINHKSSLKIFKFSINQSFNQPIQVEKDKDKFGIKKYLTNDQLIVKLYFHRINWI